MRRWPVRSFTHFAAADQLSAPWRVQPSSVQSLHPTCGSHWLLAARLLPAARVQGLGVAVSALAKNQAIAFALAPGVTVILILFGAAGR